MIQCLIVDDEPLARNLLREYLTFFGEFEIMAECGSATEAAQSMMRGTVDVLFLDIDMPHLSGIELLREMKSMPLTVLCTAHSEFALEGYELDIVDYLLKPIGLPRFTKCISKISNRLGGSLDFAQNPQIESYTPFFVKSGYKKIKIIPGEIEYIEAMEKYIRIHMKKTKIMTLMSMTEILSHLNNNTFVRVHRSYIVNKNTIEAVEGNMLVIGDAMIPVSKANRYLIDQIVN